MSRNISDETFKLNFSYSSKVRDWRPSNTLSISFWIPLRYKARDFWEGIFTLVTSNYLGLSSMPQLVAKHLNGI